MVLVVKKCMQHICSKAPILQEKQYHQRKLIVCSCLPSGMATWPRDVDILLPKCLSSCTFCFEILNIEEISTVFVNLPTNTLKF